MRLQAQICHRCDSARVYAVRTRGLWPSHLAFLPAAQLELSADELALRVASATKGCRGMLRCKYAVRAAHLALAAVKTLAKQASRGARFLATPVLLSGAEASHYLLSLIRSAVTA